MISVKKPLIALEKKLITIPILQPPNWKLPLELMCDASDKAI